MNEALINLKDAAAKVGEMTGKTPAYSTIYRWVRSGSYGVKLQTIYISNTHYTTEEWLMRFFVESSERRRKDVEQTAN